MASPRPVSTYPNRQYVALCKRVLDSGEAFLVPAQGGQAASLRQDLYAWRKACENNQDEAESLGIPVEGLRTLAFRVVAKGLEVIPQSMLVGPSLIEAALGAVPPLIDPAKAALDNLKKTLGSGEDNRG